MAEAVVRKQRSPFKATKLVSCMYFISRQHLYTADVFDQLASTQVYIDLGV